jgi:WD40 repeat protein
LHGKIIVSSSYEGTVRLWDAERRALKVEFDGRQERVVYAEFSHDGKYLATSAQNGGAELWQVAELLESGRGKEN